MGTAIFSLRWYKMRKMFLQNADTYWFSITFLYILEKLLGYSMASRGALAPGGRLDFCASSPNTHSWVKIRKSFNHVQELWPNIVEYLLIIFSFPTNLLTIIFLLNSSEIIWLRSLNGTKYSRANHVRFVEGRL